MRGSDTERNPVEILEPTMKGQVYMQSSKVKKIYKQTKKEPIIIFWYEKENQYTEIVHPEHGVIDS